MKDYSVWMMFSNPVLMSGFWGYLGAQLIKVMQDSIKNRRFTLRRMVGAGGMPSSHSAMVMAASTAAGMTYGFSSGIFGVALILAMIVMYDAAGVRRAAGEQAKVINDLVDHIFSEVHVDFKELKELLGHQPMEVFAGAVLGILIGVGSCLWIY